MNGWESRISGTKKGIERKMTDYWEAIITKKQERGKQKREKRKIAVKIAVIFKKLLKNFENCRKKVPLEKFSSDLNKLKILE